MIDAMMAKYKDLEEDEADAVLLENIGLDAEGNEISMNLIMNQIQIFLM